MANSLALFAVDSPLWASPLCRVPLVAIPAEEAQEFFDDHLSALLAPHDSDNPGCSSMAVSAPLFCCVHNEPFGREPPLSLQIRLIQETADGSFALLAFGYVNMLDTDNDPAVRRCYVECGLQRWRLSFEHADDGWELACAAICAESHSLKPSLTTLDSILSKALDGEEAESTYALACLVTKLLKHKCARARMSTNRRDYGKADRNITEDSQGLQSPPSDSHALHEAFLKAIQGLAAAQSATNPRVLEAGERRWLEQSLAELGEHRRDAIA